MNISKIISQNRKILLYIKLNLLIIVFILNIIFVKIQKKKNDKGLLRKIKDIFKKYGKININNVVYLFNKKEEKYNKEKYNNTIHIGFTLDSKFVLQTMLTTISIMATQKNTTKIVFHFGVVNFTEEDMIKIFNLRSKINNLTEFNFYYLKGAVKKMKNFHKKGEACPGKFELPELLPNNVERLLLFDGGDVLILRDLTELYNYDMKDFWVLGTPEPIGIYMNSKIYHIKKYINIGSVLFNVVKLKKNKFWDKYTENRYLKVRGQPDQSLFNILVPDNKKDYFPFRFGGLSPFKSDYNSDNLLFSDYGIKRWLNSSLSNYCPEKPSTIDRLIVQLYNPTFIHQWSGKWHSGKGLSIFRILAKYFIKIGGIGDEICKIKPGYCK